MAVRPDRPRGAAWGAWLHDESQGSRREGKPTKPPAQFRAGAAAAASRPVA